MVNLEMAAAAKAKGNEFLKAKSFEEAVAAYTEAIGHNPGDHVFYSNRCAAYQSLGKYEEALADGAKCVEIKPDWFKAYLRKGSSLQFLKKVDEAVDCFNAGLVAVPENAQLKDALAKAEAAKPNPIANMFNNPNMMGNLMSNPQTAAFMQQPDFVQKINQIRANPQMLNMHLSDPRISAALGVMLGVDIQQPGATPGGPPAGGAAPTATGEVEEVEEVTSRAEATPPKELTEEEKAAKAEEEAAKAAAAEAAKEKAEAVVHYKRAGKLKKQPEERAAALEQALAHFTKASELAPTTMSFLSNRAAVFFELGRYEECIAESEKAVTIGRENKADFSQIAKAYARAGNAEVANGHHEEGLAYYDKSLMEDYDRKVEDKVKKAKADKLKADKLAYLNDDKSDEAKALGNEAFKKGDWAEAMKQYTEAIKRNPKNHTVYSNRAGALVKMGQFPAALEDIETGLKIAPDFVKFYSRKGSIEFYLKEYHKCQETFAKVIEMAPQTPAATEAQDMLNKTQYAIRAAQSGPVDKEQQARAMQDPEIQGILADPMVRNVLNDLQSNPEGAQNALKDPSIMAKINKLVAAGILKTG